MGLFYGGKKVSGIKFDTKSINSVYYEKKLVFEEKYPAGFIKKGTELWRGNVNTFSPIELNDPLGGKSLYKGITLWFNSSTPKSVNPYSLVVTITTVETADNDGIPMFQIKGRGSMSLQFVPKEGFTGSMALVKITAS